MRSAGSKLAWPLAVTLVAWLGLTLTHHSLRGPLPAARAIAAARRDPVTRQALYGVKGSVQMAAAPVDSELERVSFSSGGRILAEAAVDRSGSVSHSVSYRTLQVPYGASLAYQPWTLVLLGALFVLSTAVVPLRRLRNLDVAMLLSLAAPMVLLQQRYLELSVLAAVPSLVYLMLRSARAALGAGPAASRAAQTPLLDALTATWEPGRRRRLMRLLLAALALVFLMVCVSSSGAVDVLFAVMEGATRVIHGTLPYGHMPGDVVHGDTYPILSYLLYAPAAALSPVTSNWDSVDLGLAMSALAAILAAGMLAGRAAWPSRRRPAAADVVSARELDRLRQAVAWLSFPPLLAIASSGTSDVVLAAAILAAALLWNRPRAGAAVISLAAWFKLAPVVLLPPFLAGLRGRSLSRAAVAVMLVSASALAVLLALGGLTGVSAMVHAMAFQLHRGSPQSVWAVLGLGALQPLGEAATLGLIAAACLYTRGEPAWREDPARIAGLIAAVLIALQLSADYWSFLYLAWVLPPLSLCLLGTPAAAQRAREPAKSSLGSGRRKDSTGARRNLRPPLQPVPLSTTI